jgi:hypothetical protein
VQLGKEWLVANGAKLAFKALTLNGQPVGDGVLVVVDGASLAADSVVMRDFPANTIVGSGAAVSITLDNVKVSGSGGPAAVQLPSQEVFTWSNVSQQAAQQCSLSFAKGGACRMLPQHRPCCTHLGSLSSMMEGFFPGSRKTMETLYVHLTSAVAVAVFAAVPTPGGVRR